MLKLDDSIATVLACLINKEMYLRRVISNMRMCCDKNQSASIRIGRRGNGKNPCYLIHYDSDGVKKKFGTFFCSKEFHNNFDEKFWCDTSMTLKQVDDLLAAVEAGKA